MTCYEESASASCFHCMRWVVMHCQGCLHTNFYPEQKRRQDGSKTQKKGKCTSLKPWKARASSAVLGQGTMLWANSGANYLETQIDLPKIAAMLRRLWNVPQLWHAAVYSVMPQLKLTNQHTLSVQWLFGQRKARAYRIWHCSWGTLAALLWSEAQSRWRYMQSWGSLSGGISCRASNRRKCQVCGAQQIVKKQLPASLSSISCLLMTCDIYHPSHHIIFWIASQQHPQGLMHGKQCKELKPALAWSGGI